MSRIGAKNTTPEMRVARLLRALDYSFTRHAKSLPGKPDIVLRARRRVIFVHGCFWHRHSCPLGQPMPATRPDFWATKFAGTKARDRRVTRALRALGWKVLVVWECQTENTLRVARRLSEFMDDGVSS